MTKRYGKLIGASLGPGDPELITRRAWAVLQSGARWLYPVKKAEESSYALSIVERGGLAIPADAEQLVFPMTRDADILAKAWTRAAASARGRSARKGRTSASGHLAGRESRRVPSFPQVLAARRPTRGARDAP